MRDVGKLVVARHRDGRIVSGRLEEFRAERASFRVFAEQGHWVPVEAGELKALFFVRSLRGNSHHRDSREFPLHSAGGTKTWIEFQDGERLAGWQISPQPLAPGIFVFPTDGTGNVEKVWIPNGSLRRVLTGPDAERAARDYNENRPPGGDMIRPECWEDMLRAL